MQYVCIFRSVLSLELLRLSTHIFDLLYVIDIGLGVEPTPPSVM